MTTYRGPFKPQPHLDSLLQPYFHNPELHMSKPLKPEDQLQLPFVRNPYNYDTAKAGNEDACHCKEPTLTQQQFAEEADINTIVERFHLTGEMPAVKEPPAYGDFSGIFDFQTAMNAVRNAQESFDALPANIRARFHNQPAEFLEFVQNDENRPEAEKLGLVPKKPPLQPTAPAAPAPASDPKGGTTTPPHSKQA